MSRPVGDDISLVAVHQPIIVASKELPKMVTLNTTKNVASKVFTFGNLSPTTTKDNNDGNESFASNQTKGGSLATRITLLITKILCSNQQEDDVQELEGLLKELNGIKTLALKHSCCLKTRNLLAEKAPSE